MMVQLQLTMTSKLSPHDEKGAPKLSRINISSCDQLAIRQRHRVNLFMQVHILLKYLARVDPCLRMKVLLALKVCYRRIRCKNTKHMSLADLIEKNVREVVGEKHWEIAEKLRCSNSTLLLHSKIAFVQKMSQDEKFQSLRTIDWSK